MIKILIVEDEYEFIEDIGERFKEGYEVDVARDASEAKGYIEKNKYGVVLLDIMFPTGDSISGPPERAGVEILKMIREKSSETKVVVLTGVVSGKTISSIKEYHPEELINKPIDGNELYDLMIGLAKGDS
ncbi:MAG: response regulator [bacterium]|nr:response regulator [bacterium]